MSVTDLDSRLGSVAALVRQGAVLADIGTDHAYLPLFLLREGQISFAYCCDVAEGPLERARENAADTPYLDRMRFILTDGLSGLSDEPIDDVCICGMGGELIACIIDRAAFLRDGRYRLILQPMTKQEHLRTYLAAHGFSIEKEVFSEAEGKFYVTMLVGFGVAPRALSPVEALMGTTEAIDPRNRAQLCYFLSRRRALICTVEGKHRGGLDTEDEEALIRAIEQALMRGGDLSQ